MARTLIGPVLSFSVACVVACGNGKTDGGSPPFTTGGTAGVSTNGSGGTAVNGAGGSNTTSGSASGSNGSGGASSSSGSGPSTSSGGVSPSSGGSSFGGSSSMPNPQLPNGYWAVGSWKGRAWGKTTGTGSTMMPAAFDSVPFGMPYCASGSVGPMSDYSGTATVGVNLNQEADPSAPANPVTPTKDGITVNVTNRGGSALRVELRGPNAETDTAQRWCASIMGSGGFIPWSSFNTACWDGSGAAYNREPIVSAAILVPGSNSNAVSYDVCLNSLNEGMPGATSGSGGASGGGGASSSSGGSNGNRGGASNQGGVTGSGTAGTAGGDPKPIMNSGTLKDRYDWQPVEHEGRNYVVQNNVWGSGASQTVTYNETSFKVTAQSGTNGTNGAPVSYPSTFIGSNYERTTMGSNLPKLVSSIASVQTSWTNNAGGGIGGTYNASYDVWFSTKAEGDPEAPSGGYLMVWFYDPANAQPIGSVVASNVSVSGVSGSWNIWLGNNGPVPCISYVRTQSIQSMTFDLNAFIQHAVGRGTIKSNWYLSNVFAGFEIWNGGVGLESSGFYAIVN
ncbi:MAG TPA: hypothetical protein VFQ35_21840 [Polyangiaceae bacterium]|nr:hypothetical protein [Polyangiaceae bacterium]